MALDETVRLCLSLGVLVSIVISCLFCVGCLFRLREEDCVDDRESEDGVKQNHGS